MMDDMKLPDDHVDEKVENEFYVSSDFHMMNVLTSKVRSADFENQMRNFYRLAYSVTVKDIVGVVLVIKFLHNFLFRELLCTKRSSCFESNSSSVQKIYGS